MNNLGQFSTASNLRRILMIKNRIKNLNRHFCIECAQVKNVMISNCNLETIEEEAFEGLISLTTLDLSQNFIELLPPGILSPLVKLYSLSFKSNRIKSFSEDLFAKNFNLIIILFAKNELSTVDIRAFKHLNTLVAQNVQYTIVYKKFTKCMLFLY